MREELKKFWNKYKKYIVIFILMIFVLNFIFVITDWIAGKGFNGKAILYSPVSNEEWLSFIGVFVGGFATFLLFLSAKETLKNERIKFRNENKMKEKEFELERNKVRYENELKKLEKEKSVVEEYLNALDIDEVYNIISLINKNLSEKNFSSNKEIIMKNIEFSRIQIMKNINLAKIKLNCNTDFKVLIRKDSLKNGKKENLERNKECEKLEENEKVQILKDSINKKLNYLYAIYIKILGNIFIECIKAESIENLKEISSLIKEDKISDYFQKIYKKPEIDLCDSIKSNLKEDIDKGDYVYPFYICLDLTVDELTEYFDKKESNIKKDI